MTLLGKQKKRAFKNPHFHWIGLREHLQESPIYLMVKTHGFPVPIFPTKPIQWHLWFSKQKMMAFPMLWWPEAEKKKTAPRQRFNGVTIASGSSGPMDPRHPKLPGDSRKNTHITRPGKLTKSYWSHGHRNSGFTHWKWWFSIVM